MTLQKDTSAGGPCSQTHTKTHHRQVNPFHRHIAMASIIDNGTCSIYVLHNMATMVTTKLEAIVEQQEGGMQRMGAARHSGTYEMCVSQGWDSDYVDLCSSVLMAQWE